MRAFRGLKNVPALYQGDLMARTIGIRNKNIIKRTVEDLIKKRTTAWGEITSFPKDQEVIDLLPDEMFDTWEGAYSEIKNVIHDSVMRYDKKLKKVI